MAGPALPIAPAHPGCPKRMHFGPCGGVEFDGGCEVGDFACVFLDEPTVRWPGTTGADGGGAVVVGARADAGLGAEVDAQAGAGAGAVAGAGAEVDARAGAGADAGPAAGARAQQSGAADVRAPQPGAAAMRAVLARRQVVVGDLPARALDRAALEDTARVLAGHVDAALAGDSGRERVQFPPAYRAHLAQSAGLPIWTGLNARDRNRVALEGELAALAEVGVAAVHCVTGDHTDTGDRPDARPVFDLDSTRIAALARAAGHFVSVGESPLTPPVGRRAARLRQKVRAGAELCFVNHAGGVDPVRRFIADSHEQGIAPGFIVCVPMVIDHGSAALLRSFTTLVVPEGYLEGILDAADPLAAGLEAATRLSAELLALDGVVGVNLSGGPAPGAERAFAEALATVADRLALRG